MFRPLGIVEFSDFLAWPLRGQASFDSMIFKNNSDQIICASLFFDIL